MPLRLLSFAKAIAAFGLGSLLVTAGCGGDDDAQADAGPPRSARLVILTPPGDIVGLSFNASTTLRVLYETDAGEPIADERVGFAILATGAGEDPGGSTLSETQATSDAQGIARIDLKAGAERTHFRVEVSATDAPSTRFYVAVSQTGFARLIVTPVHEGWRAADSFERIELRLYRTAELRCADMRIDDLPSPVFPPRSLAEFGGAATYQSVTSGESYAIVAWTQIAGSATRMSAGCMELGQGQVPPGDITLTLVVRDRSLVLPSSVTLTSSIDLGPIAAAISSGGGDRAWRTLACPTGPGQLLLDCTLDALAPDAVLDCEVDSEAPIVAQVETQRGTADADGCRPALIGSDPSLDQQLLDGVAAGATWPLGADLDALLHAREDTLDSFELESELTIEGPTSARHRLTTARLEVGGEPFEMDLLSSSRPVLQQSQVPIDIVGTPLLDIGEHGFTLRYGSIAQAAFETVGLAPRALADRAHDLGTALVDSVTGGGVGEAGCPSVSAIICGAIGSPLGCAEEACATAAAHLDEAFVAWSQRINGVGIDFTVSGQATLYDDDNDLYVDAIGRTEELTPTGSWTAIFELASGQDVGTTARFGSERDDTPPE